MESQNLLPLLRAERAEWATSQPQETFALPTEAEQVVGRRGRAMELATGLQAAGLTMETPPPQMEAVPLFNQMSAGPALTPWEEARRTASGGTQAPPSFHGASVVQGGKEPLVRHGSWESAWPHAGGGGVPRWRGGNDLEPGLPSESAIAFGATTAYITEDALDSGNRPYYEDDLAQGLILGFMVVIIVVMAFGAVVFLVAVRQSK